MSSKLIRMSLVFLLISICTIAPFIYFYITLDVSHTNVPELYQPIYEMIAFFMSCLFITAIYYYIYLKKWVLLRLEILSSRNICYDLQENKIKILCFVYTAFLIAFFVSVIYSACLQILIDDVIELDSRTKYLEILLYLVIVHMFSFKTAKKAFLYYSINLTKLNHIHKNKSLNSYSYNLFDSDVATLVYQTLIGKGKEIVYIRIVFAVMCLLLVLISLISHFYIVGTMLTMVGSGLFYILELNYYNYIILYRLLERHNGMDKIPTFPDKVLITHSVYVQNLFLHFPKKYESIKTIYNAYKSELVKRGFLGEKVNDNIMFQKIDINLIGKEFICINDAVVCILKTNGVIPVEFFRVKDIKKIFNEKRNLRKRGIHDGLIIHTNKKKYFLYPGDIKSWLEILYVNL